MSEPMLLQLAAPQGSGALRLDALTASEALGRLFEIEMAVLSEQSDIDPDKLLGKGVSVGFELADRKKRYLHGLVTRFSLGGGRGRFFTYALTVRPWLWMLTRRADTRIFQGRSIPEILQDVFQPYSTDFDNKLKGTYAKLDYCVQYRETDFGFVSRLMEREGIYYYFTHAADRHTLVLADTPMVHEPWPGHEKFLFRPNATGSTAVETINEWRASHEIQPGKVSLSDYDFKHPTTGLLASAEHPRTHDASKYEIYDPPGNHLTAAEGSRYAQLRVAELAAQHTLASGSGMLTALATGRRFSLLEHPRKDQNHEYIVVSTHIVARNASPESAGAETDSFACQFTALDSREVFRPQRLTLKPVVPGPQTALVVGPGGHEIHTDEFGRVKVQFYWDRLGKKDANSSCWMRVAHPWAGKGWGMVSLPRIGQEVVVEFLEGDPDRPLITGSVYNGDNAPPYTLPDNATVSTVKSRSSKGGASANFNELRFEDKKGEEYVWFQAEKDRFELVKNDVVTSIGHDQMVSVGNDRKEKITGVQHLQVVKDVTHKIGGTLSTAVTGDICIKTDGEHGVKAAQDINAESGQSITSKAQQDVQVKAGMNSAFESGMNVHLKGGMNVVVEAGMMLTLKAGSSFITLGPAGVAINGTMVLINSGGGPGSGSGAQPVAPTPPQDPDDPAPVKDPLLSR